MPRKRKNRDRKPLNSPAEAHPAPLGKPKRRWLPLAILLGVAFLSYANALRDGFVADDNLQILRNQYVTDFGKMSEIFGMDVWGFVGGGTSNYYRPLQLVLYNLEYQAYGNHPWVWHLMDLFLNAGVIALAYFLVLELADADLAFWATLLFALHPMHVEAVVWVAALPDLLCGFLLFAAMLAYHKGRSRRGSGAVWYFVLAVLAFFAAEFTKETALLFPALILSYEFFYRRVPLLQLWKCLPRLLPYAAALVIYVSIRFSALGSFTPNSGTYLLLRPRQLVFAIPVLIARYVGKLVMPLHFNYFYDTPPVTSFNAYSAGAILLATAIVAAMFLLREGQPLLAFALSWFLLILAPALDINAIGENYFTERYLYIPSLGFAILAAWGWLWLLRRAGSGAGRWAAWTAIAIVLCFYFVQIERRIPVFRNNLSLYETTVLASPGSAHIQASLASADHEAGDLPGSIQHGYLAVTINPDYALAQTNLGNSLVEVGRTEEGIPHLEAALAQSPNTVATVLSLAKADVDAHRWQEAEQCYRRAAELDPDKANYYGHLADMAASGEQRQEEIAKLRDAVALHPESLDDWNELGRAYARLSQWSDAMACFKEILKRKPGDVPALLELSVAGQAKGDIATAISAGQKALATRPDDSGLRLNLASVYGDAGRIVDSISLLSDLLRDDPKFVHADQAHFTLGLDYEKNSRWAAAADQYRQALQLNPQFTPARQHLDAIQSRIPAR